MAAKVNKSGCIWICVGNVLKAFFVQMIFRWVQTSFRCTSNHCWIGVLKCISLPVIHWISITTIYAKPSAMSSGFDFQQVAVWIQIGWTAVKTAQRISIFRSVFLLFRIFACRYFFSYRVTCKHKNGHEFIEPES